MKVFVVLAFVMASLLGTVCAKNVTLPTITATFTKTVFHTLTTSINVATLPGFAPHGPASGSSASAGYDLSLQLKSMAVQTIELTSTIFSTEVDGVVVTSLSTIVAPVTSTSLQEVTSTTTKHAGTTITTTSVIVSASTPSATASSISIEQNIAQMWGLNGSDHVQVSRWLAFSVVVLGVAHYLFFAHH